ncbi:MAG: DUF1611 domain-containing protein [Nitrosospira sp.]|nr:DUF1611 domain-containing protein [Nitrosospira sp.]
MKTMFVSQSLPITRERLLNAKVAYTSRNINLELANNTLLTGDDIAPSSGDLVLARVEEIGQHSRLELACGRHASLFEGDEIVVCYGNCYAPDQFEAEVPGDLGLCNLVASGGIAARARSCHTDMKTPTSIRPIGLLANSTGKRINLMDAALPKITGSSSRPYTIAVLGTSMNAGKSTTAAALIRGLVGAGRVVGAAKVTGTGSGRDAWLMTDAGSKLTLDFTHAGFPSTYLAKPSEVDKILETLTAYLTKAGTDVIVIEVADGLFQSETAALLDSSVFSRMVDSVIFAASDSMGATAGVKWLHRKRLPVIAVSGLLTASPLAIVETAKATGLPVLDKKELGSASIVNMLNIPVRMPPLRSVTRTAAVSGN